MDGSGDTALKLTRIPVNVDFATLHLKIRNIFGPPAGYLMGSDMLSAKNVRRKTVLYPLLNPLCGQLRNSFGFLGIQKWMSY